ncbi:MAG: helix-hairpin-helix domain-containing protein [Chloroflexota bacterium]
MNLIRLETAKEVLPMSNSWLDRNRHLVFLGLLITALSGAGLFYFRQPATGPVEILSEQATATTIPAALPSPTPTPAPVRVYVTGAVSEPDVYFLPPGSIIKDAILAAGGCTPDADLERINQALELQDQQQIRVPRLGEENSPPPVQGGADPSAPGNSRSLAVDSSRINLNTATLEELDSLPGIGPAIGQRIIDYRESIGGFKSVDQITQVSGIGEATLAKIRDKITVE